LISFGISLRAKMADDAALIRPAILAAVLAAILA
jgi:hypothetical protein